MKFKDFGLRWNGPHCPYLVIQIVPGLPAGSLEGTLTHTESECGIAPEIVPTPNKWETHVIVALPYLFRSDHNWWIDMTRISTIVARIIRVALDVDSWNGTLDVGVVADDNMLFRDEQGLWTANVEAVNFPVGLMDIWRTEPNAEEGPGDLRERLAYPCQLLVSGEDSTNPFGVGWKESPVCFHTLLRPQS